MRDLHATKRAILDAAEVLFAERGYDGVSVQQIATAAGVSRGMPGYAFGSKRGLYQAVLAGALAQPRALLADLAGHVERGDVEEALRAGIGAYIDFLAEHPTYVALLQREALDGRPRQEEEAVVAEPAQDALAVVSGLLEAAGYRAVDTRQLVVSTIALCFFPMAHRHTMLAPLGLDASDEAFLAARKAHVVDLLLNGLRAG